MHKFFLILGAMIILVGCSPAAAPAAPTQSPPPTKVPATEAPKEAWQVAQKISYSHAVYYAGFQNKAFGITVGYGGEIHYTTDSGATWPKAANSSMCRFGLEIVNDQVAWNCGNGGHVRKSTDGGQTWQAVADFGPSEPNQCRFLSFLDETTGWAATPSQLAMTNDGGATWQDIALPADAQAIAAIELRTPQDGYLLGKSGKLYITADGGKSWTSQALAFTRNAFPGKMPSPLAAMRFPDAKRGLVVMSRGNQEEGFYIWSAYTEDGGATWQEDKVPVAKGIPNLYLSRDGSTLTVLDTIMRQVTVLQFQH